MPVEVRIRGPSVEKSQVVFQDTAGEIETVCVEVALCVKGVLAAFEILPSTSAPVRLSEDPGSARMSQETNPLGTSVAGKFPVIQPIFVFGDIPAVWRYDTWRVFPFEPLMTKSAAQAIAEEAS